MNEFPMKKITIYHKNNGNYTRISKMASFRSSASNSYSKNGVESQENATIRVFDYDGYNNTWKCEKGDVIVDKEVFDTITTAPITELQQNYGNDHVFQVSSITINIFGEELDHIKIGAR